MGGAGPRVPPEAAAPRIDDEELEGRRIFPRQGDGEAVAPGAGRGGEESEREEQREASRKHVGGKISFIGNGVKNSVGLSAAQDLAIGPVTIRQAPEFIEFFF